MPRICSVCAHPARKAIDLDLLHGKALEHIAAEHPGLTKSALCRHRKNGHIAQYELYGDADIQRTLTEARQAMADRLQGPRRFEDRLRELRDKVDALLAQAEREKNRKLMLDTLREARGLLDLEAKIILQLLDLKGNHEDQLTVHYEAV